MFRSIRWKLTLLNVAVLFVILLLTESMVFLTMKQQMFSQTDEMLRLGSDRGNLRVLSPGWSLMTPMRAPVSFVIWSATGQPDYVSANFPATPPGPQRTETLTQQQNMFSTVWMGDTPYRTFTKALRLRNFTGYMTLYVDVSQEYRTLNTLGIILLILLGVGLLLTFSAGYLLAKRALIPIRRAWQRQTEFVADASHELRTPMSIIRMNLEIAMRDRSASVAEVHEWLADAHQETEWMSRMVDQLLTLARTDTSDTVLEIESVDLSGIIYSASEQMEVLFQETGIKFSFDVEKGVYYDGDSGRLRQLTVILLDNALKYTPAGGQVHCDLVVQGTEALLTVTDTGIGIPNDELPHIFERFYRVDKARSRSVGGTGLGLAIGKWIADAHKARISVSSTFGEGTQVTVHFYGARLANILDA